MSIIDITNTQLRARVYDQEYIADFANAVIQPAGWIDLNVLYWYFKSEYATVNIITVGNLVHVTATDKEKSVTLYMQKAADYHCGPMGQIYQLTNSLQQKTAEYTELKVTHQQTVERLQHITTEYEKSSHALYDAHSTIANMTETIGGQEKIIKRHIYDKDAMESTFILLNNETKTEHEEALHELKMQHHQNTERSKEERQQMRRQILALEEQVKITCATAATALERLEEAEKNRAESGIMVNVTVNPTWSCPCCVEDFTPSHDSVICINALCNVRLCMSCIRKLPARRDYIKCPYCRAEYKINEAVQTSDLKNQIHGLHAKCAELVKIINLGPQHMATMPPMAADVLHNTPPSMLSIIPQLATQVVPRVICYASLVLSPSHSPESDDE